MPRILSTLVVCFFIVISSTIKGLCYKPNLDTLELRLENSVDQKEQIDLLNQISYLVFNKDVNKCKSYAEQALGLSIKHSYKKGEAKAYHNLGIAFGITQNDETVITYFQRSLQLAEEINDSLTMAGASNGLAITNSNWGNYEEGIKYYYKSLSIYEDLGNVRGRILTLSNLGHAYLELRQIENAEEAYLSSLTLVRTTNFNSLEVWCLDNLAKFYLKQGQLVKAKSYCEEANYLAIDLDTSSVLIDLFMTTSQIESKYKQIVAAEKNARQAELLAEQIGNIKLTIQSKLNLISVLSESGKNRQALSLSKEVLNLINTHSYTEEKIRYYEVMDNLHKSRNEYKRAYDYYTLHNNLQDSLISAGQQLSVSTLTERFEKEQAVKANEALKLLYDLESRTSLLLKIGLLLLTLALLLGVFLYKRNTNIQKELTKTNKELQIIVNNSQEGITYRKTENNELIFASDLALKILGANSFAQLKQSNLLDLCVDDVIDGTPKEEILSKAYTEILREGSYENVLRYRGLDGREFWLRIKTIFDESDSKTPKYISFIKDVTDDYETQIAIKQKNEALQKYIESNIQLEQFAHVASHDLRAPVITIKSFAKILETKAKDRLTQEEQKYLTYIKSNAAQMFDLVTDLLDYSKINSQHLKISSIDVNTVVNGIYNTLQSQAEERGVVLEIHQKLPTILADEIKIKRVFQNLIGNAIKFSDNNKDSIVRIQYIEYLKHWEFLIIDNGIGIQDSKSDIFKPYVQLNNKSDYKGSGLGLSISQRIISQHGGDITYKSEYGVGSEFKFTISKQLT